MMLLNKLTAFGRALATKCTLLRLRRNRFGRHLHLAGATTKPTLDTIVSNFVPVGTLKGIGDVTVAAGLTCYHYTVTFDKQSYTWAVGLTLSDMHHYKKAYEDAMIGWDTESECYASVMEKLRNTLEPKVGFHAECVGREFCQ